MSLLSFKKIVLLHTPKIVINLPFEKNHPAKFEIDRAILTCLKELTVTNERTDPNYRKASLEKA